MSVVASATTASARGNVAWSAAEAAVSGLLSAASVFIVARLIGPAEVGVGAASVAVNVVLCCWST